MELEGKDLSKRSLLADIRIRDERDQLPYPLLSLDPWGSGVLAGCVQNPHANDRHAESDEKNQPTLEPFIN